LGAYKVGGGFLGGGEINQSHTSLTHSSAKQVGLRNTIAMLQDRNLATSDPRAFRYNKTTDLLVIDYFIINYLLGGAWEGGCGSGGAIWLTRCTHPPR